jgi:proliferating cell nuclear antigen
MKLTLADPRFLKDSISIIADLVTEAQFKITPDSIELMAMDPASVAMVTFKLLSSSFEEYDVKEEQIIALNLNNMKQVLKRANNCKLSLELADNNLKIVMKGRSTKTFMLPLIEVEDNERKTPSLNFEATIVTDSSVLTEVIDDMDIIGESVSFEVDKGIFRVSSKGDLSKANVDITADEKTKIVADTKFKSKYSLEYLKKMIQGAKLAPQATFQFANDYPLKLEYKVLNKMQLIFILAPRVEND